MIIKGNRDLLDHRAAVILNSSQSKTPCGHDRWISSTSLAVADLTGAGYTIITSIGLQTWELAACLTAKNKGSQIIISPEIDNEEGDTIFRDTLDRFDLNPDNTAMVFTAVESKANKPKSGWIMRDKAALHLADRIVPVSIRRGGKLQALIKNLDSRKEIDPRFSIEYNQPLSRPARYNIETVNRRYPAIDYIIHWTRTCHGPWPGEKESRYYERLLKSGDEYTNNGFNTLINIIREQRIRASSRKIRKGIRAVGFSDMNPGEMLGWMRWLPKRVNWNFEPYGVGIRKDTAIRMGIRPVIYGGRDDYDKIPADDRPYFQGAGEKDVDWRQEREWRHIGDLDLSAIPEKDFIYYVWRGSESGLLDIARDSKVVVLGPY